MVRHASSLLLLTYASLLRKQEGEKKEYAADRSERGRQIASELPRRETGQFMSREEAEKHPEEVKEGTGPKKNE